MQYTIFQVNSEPVGGPLRRGGRHVANAANSLVLPEANRVALAGEVRRCEATKLLWLSLWLISLEVLVVVLVLLSGGKLKLKKSQITGKKVFWYSQLLRGVAFSPLERARVSVKVLKAAFGP